MAGSVLTPYRNIQKKSWQSPICRCQDPTQDAFSSWWTARQVIPKLQPSLLGQCRYKSSSLHSSKRTRVHRRSTRAQCVPEKAGSASHSSNRATTDGWAPS